MSGLMKQCGIPQQKRPARLRPDIDEMYENRNVHGNVREQKCTWKCTRAEMYMEMYESRNVHGNVREQKCTWKCTRAEMYMEMYESRNVQYCTWKCTRAEMYMEMYESRNVHGNVLTILVTSP